MAIRASPVVTVKYISSPHHLVYCWPRALPATRQGVKGFYRAGLQNYIGGNSGGYWTASVVDVWHPAATTNDVMVTSTAFQDATYDSPAVTQVSSFPGVITPDGTTRIYFRRRDSLTGTLSHFIKVVGSTGTGQPTVTSHAGPASFGGTLTVGFPTSTIILMSGDGATIALFYTFQQNAGGKAYTNVYMQKYTVSTMAASGAAVQITLATGADTQWMICNAAQMNGGTKVQLGLRNMNLNTRRVYYIDTVAGTFRYDEFTSPGAAPITRWTSTQPPYAAYLDADGFWYSILVFDETDVIKFKLNNVTNWDVPVTTTRYTAASFPASWKLSLTHAGFTWVHSTDNLEHYFVGMCYRYDGTFPATQLTQEIYLAHTDKNSATGWTFPTTGAGLLNQWQGSSYRPFFQPETGSNTPTHPTWAGLLQGGANGYTRLSAMTNTSVTYKEAWIDIDWFAPAVTYKDENVSISTIDSISIGTILTNVYNDLTGVAVEVGDVVVIGEIRSVLQLDQTVAINCTDSLLVNYAVLTIYPTYYKGMVCVLSGGNGNASPALSLGGLPSTHAAGVVANNTWDLNPGITGLDYQFGRELTLGNGSLTYDADLKIFTWVPPEGGTYLIAASGNGLYEFGMSVVKLTIASLPVGDVSSTVQISRKWENVLDDVSAAERLTNTTNYRCVYVYNPSATITCTNVVVSTIEPTYGNLDVGSENVNQDCDGVTGGTVTLVDESTPGATVGGISWSNSVALGTIAPLKYKSFWIKRDIPNNTGVALVNEFGNFDVVYYLEI